MKNKNTDGTIIQFLHGSHSFQGVWFGDKHPTLKGDFWWRKFLPASDPILCKGGEKSAEDCLNNNKPYGRNWEDFLLPDQMEFLRKAFKDFASQFPAPVADTNNEVRGEKYWEGFEFACATLESMGYDRQTNHPFLLSDCVRAKCNHIKGKVRKNPHYKEMAASLHTVAGVSVEDDPEPVYADYVPAYENCTPPHSESIDKMAEERYPYFEFNGKIKYKDSIDTQRNAFIAGAQSVCGDAIEFFKYLYSTDMVTKNTVASDEALYTLFKQQTAK